MNMNETAQALGLAQAFDRRTVGEMDVRAWHLVLANLPAGDVMQAIQDHYAVETDWIMPAHIRRACAEMARQRQISPWAPGQYGTPRDEAAPEVAFGERLALSDLPAAVSELVARVRAGLPEGSKEALAPRRVAWDREHSTFVRVQTSEPNPLYRPGAADARVGCDWHEESGLGYRWDCGACQARNPGAAGEPQQCAGGDSCRPEAPCSGAAPHVWSA